MQLKITKVDWVGDSVDLSHYCTTANFAEITANVVAQKMQSFAVNGIPADWHEQCIEFQNVLVERSDIMLYPDKKTIAEANQIFDSLTTVIAMLAFIKGGIELFGYRFEGAIDGCSKA